MDNPGSRRQADISLSEEDLAAVAVCSAAACSAFIVISAINARNQMRRRRLGNRIRNRATFAQVTSFLNDAEFQRAFRLSRTSFRELLAVLQTDLSNDQRMAIVSSGSPVEPAVRLALTLRILSGGSHHDLAMLFRVSTVTIYSVFHATVDVINKRLKLPGVPLDDTTELQKLAEGFALSRRIQSPIFGVVGALDGIALKISKPEDQHVPRNYWCRKGYYAIPVQAIVDSNYRFTYMSAMAVGSTHDSLAFSLSRLGVALERDGLPDGYWIAADAAYECSDSILSPWSEHQTKDAVHGTARDAFNYYHSSSRVHVEQAFGILVSRFGILWRPLRFKLARAPRILAACMRIHNHCIDSGAPSLQVGLSKADKASLENCIARWWQASNEIRRCITAEYAQGRRTDRELSALRDRLTQKLEAEGVLRPKDN